jgi:N-acetylglucosaminyldiphosphoundecaprenol N-acetyl-beta-D-mannosaminyltransferase
VGCVNLSGILRRVSEWCQAAELRTILYVNANCLNLACQDAGLRRALNAADLVYPDGISVVWSSRLLGGCRMQKLTGADWIDDFCLAAQANAWRIYILGGKPGIARQARANLLIKYPQIQIVGAQDGFFCEMTEAQVIADIQHMHPHVVFVGLGTPAQEKWLAAQRTAILAPVCWAVGALFDYVAGAEPRAPRLVRAFALEWMWRLMIDPLGKWKRYLLGNPVFAWRILRQRLGMRISTVPREKV